MHLGKKCTYRSPLVNATQNYVFLSELVDVQSLIDPKSDVFGFGVEEMRSHGTIFITKTDCVLESYPRCARLLPVKSSRNMCGYNPTENGDFEDGACVHTKA